MSILDPIAILGLAGVLFTVVGGGGIGAILPTLLIVGLLDGPRGGRLGRRAGYAAGREVHRVASAEVRPAA